MAPLISHVYELGLMEAISIPQTECFQGIVKDPFAFNFATFDTMICNEIVILITGAIQFARSEGLIPAPEPTHAIAATIREALHCRETGEAKVILTAMCGHGHFDLPAYEKYLQGNMVDLSFSEDRLKASHANIPSF